MNDRLEEIEERWLSRKSRPLNDVAAVDMVWLIADDKRLREECPNRLTDVYNPPEGIKTWEEMYHYENRRCDTWRKRAKAAEAQLAEKDRQIGELKDALVKIRNLDYQRAAINGTAFIAHNVAVEALAEKGATDGR